MNDVDERDLEGLRAMFGRRESDVAAPQLAPTTLLRRARRRQLRTGLLAGSAALSLAVAALAIPGLLFRTGTYVPSSDQNGIRTAEVSGFVIEYPSKWYLTLYLDRRALDPSPIVLTNFDPGTDPAEPCDRPQGIPVDGVLLRIVPDRFDPESELPAWPVDLSPAISGGCGDERFEATWRTDISVYSADAVFGSAASEASRKTLENTFGALRFASSQYTVGGGSRGGANSVIAAGRIDDRPWLFTARPDGDQPGVYLDMSTSNEGGGLSGAGFGGVAAADQADLTMNPAIMHGNMLLYGGVAHEVTRVVVTPEGSDPFDAELFDLPASFQASVRVFVAPMEGAPRGTVDLYDAAGNLIVHAPFLPDQACWSKYPCAGPASSMGTVAQGQAFGTQWRIVEEDAELRLIDGDGATLATVDRAPDPIRLGTYTFTDGERELIVPFGVAPADATYVVLFTSGLPSEATIATLSDGSVAFWAPVTGPLDGPSQIVALDGDCRVLGAIDLRTGQPAEPAVTDCAT